MRGRSIRRHRASGRVLGDLMAANLERASLRSAHLEGANLSDAV
jgi:uncharacterized protein YjbI with pentapeptide repeats